MQSVINEFDIINLMSKIRWIIILVVLILAGFLIQKYLTGSRARAYEFSGSIQKVDGQTLYLHGNYNSPDHPEWRAESQAVDVKVRVGSDTKLVKITILRPADFAAQIRAGKAIDPETLKQEISAGSINDLASGKVNGAVIETSNNIYGDKNFTAQSITYYYAVDEK